MTTLGQLLGQAEAAAAHLSSSAGTDLDTAFAEAATRSAAWPRLAAHSNRLLEAIGWHSSTLSRIAAATPVPVPADRALARIADLMGAAADLIHSSPDMVHKATPTEWSRRHLLDNHPDIGAVATAVYGPLARAAVWTLEPLHVATVSALWQSETMASGPLPTGLDELINEASDAAFSTHRTLTRLATLTAPANPLEYHLDIWQRAAHAALRHEPHRHTLRLISYTMAALCSAASNGLDSRLIEVPDGAIDQLRRAATTSLRTSRWPDHVRLEGQVDRELALASHDLRNQLLPLFSPGAWAAVDSGAATVRLVVDVAARIARHHHDAMRTVPIWINSRYVPVGTHTPVSRAWKRVLKREPPLTITREDQRRGRWVQLSPTTVHPELDILRTASRTLTDLLDGVHNSLAVNPAADVEAAAHPARRSSTRYPDLVHPLREARLFVAGLDLTAPLTRSQAVGQAARRAAGWHELAAVGDRLLTVLGSPSPALRSICQATPLPLPPEPILQQLTAVMATAATQIHGPDEPLHAETVDILTRVARWTIDPHQHLDSDSRFLTDALRRFLAEDAARGVPTQGTDDIDPVQGVIRTWQAIGRATLDNRPAAPTMRRLAADLTTVITVATDAAIVIEEEGGLPTDTVQGVLGHLATARRASHPAGDWPAHLRTGEGHDDPAFVTASENLRNQLQPTPGHNPWTMDHPNLIARTRLLVSAGSDLATRFAQVVTSQPIKSSGEYMRIRTQPTRSGGSGRRQSTPEMDAQLIAAAREHPHYTVRELAQMLGYSSPGQVHARLRRARANGVLPGSTRAKYRAIGPGRAVYDRLVSGSREMAASLALAHRSFTRIMDDPGLAPHEQSPATSTALLQAGRSVESTVGDAPRWEVIQPPTRHVDVPSWQSARPFTIAP